jgi:hypothetical protein
MFHENQWPATSHAVKPALVTTSVKQQLVLCDLIFISLPIVFYIMKPVLSNHERASVAERPSSIFIVLMHWNNSPQFDMSLHSDTLFWFRANQYLLFLFNAACLAEKQQISIL